ncbi:MAG: hypothetical protein LBU68_00875 [Rickettsiales bacterium]|jgi:predicted negative regulator of RcsB-dependent stress response|nr:hypothetical protein [Rickettsiales bacterium]
MGGHDTPGGKNDHGSRKKIDKNLSITEILEDARKCIKEMNYTDAKQNRNLFAEQLEDRQLNVLRNFGLQMLVSLLNEHLERLAETGEKPLEEMEDDELKEFIKDMRGNAQLHRNGNNYERIAFNMAAEKAEKILETRNYNKTDIK